MSIVFSHVESLIPPYNVSTYTMFVSMSQEKCLLFSRCLTRCYTLHHMKDMYIYTEQSDGALSGTYPLIHMEIPIPMHPPH